MSKSPAEARKAVRRLVVTLREKGLTYAAIAEQSGLSKTAVVNIWNRSRLNPEDPYGEMRRGRIKNKQRCLNPDEERKAWRAIVNQYGYPNLPAPTLWSYGATQQYFASTFDVHVQKATVAKYLREWGLNLSRERRHFYRKFMGKDGEALMTSVSKRMLRQKTTIALLETLQITKFNTRDQIIEHRELLLATTSLGTLYWKSYRPPLSSRTRNVFMRAISAEFDNRKLLFIIVDPSIPYDEELENDSVEPEENQIRFRGWPGLQA